MEEWNGGRMEKFDNSTMEEWNGGRMEEWKPDC
jgi:hypothetical protein